MHGMGFWYPVPVPVLDGGSVALPRTRTRIGPVPVYTGEIRAKYGVPRTSPVLRGIVPTPYNTGETPYLYGATLGRTSSVEPRTRVFQPSSFRNCYYN